jgi:hypothetical protein
MCQSLRSFSTPSMRRTFLPIMIKFNRRLLGKHQRASGVGTSIRAAQTGVFDLDIRISNRPFIDVCMSFAAETCLQSRNVEKAINAV